MDKFALLNVLGMDWLEIFTLVTGVAYVILEIKQKNFMWVVGMLTSAAAMWVFFRGGLYASAALNVYYFGISFWGLYRWRKDAAAMGQDVVAGCEKDGTAGGTMGAESAAGAAEEAIHLCRLRWQDVIAGAAAFVLGTAALVFLLRYLDDPMSSLDACVAVLSAVATYWLAKAYLEQWLLWIVADTVSAVLCLTQGMYWMSLMYVAYTAGAVYGYFHWRRFGRYPDSHGRRLSEMN